MINPGVTGAAGGELCFSVQEFAMAMGSAQGQIIANAGTAMISFLLIGILIGAGLATMFWMGKQKIDQLEAEKAELESEEDEGE